LVILVLDHIEADKPALFSAVLTHPTWAKHGLAILWRDVPLATAFAKVTGNQRQVYADRVQRLSVSLFDDHEAAASHPLRFPRLREIVLDETPVAKKDSALLRPSTSEDDGNAAHDDLSNSARQLLLNLDVWLSLVVTSVTINCENRAALALLLPFFLANGHLMELRSLTIAPLLTPDDVRCMSEQSGTSNRFAHMRSMSAYLDHAAAATLTAALQPAPIVRLKLSVQGKRPRRILLDVARLTSLHELILFLPGAELRRREILALCALRRLRTLRLEYVDGNGSNQPFDTPHFDAADLEQLLRGLPLLRRFTFGGTSGWRWGDGSVLRRVGEAAPCLERLSLYGLCALQALDPRAVGPVFPRLEVLELNTLKLLLPPGQDPNAASRAGNLE
jgi:hypothetical protein